MIALPPAASLRITNTRFLAAGGWQQGDLLIRGGQLIADDGSDGDSVVNGKGLWALPGIVDLHGDAFERAITPRPGVSFPLEQGIAENDAALISCGITTFYYAITDGFEPGLRSRATVRALLSAIEALAPRLRCRSQLHIRHETANVEAPEELIDWMRDGRIHLLSLNDHLPDLNDAVRLQRYRSGLTRRVAMNESAIEQFLIDLHGQHQRGAAIVEELCAAAHQHRVALAAHDDWSLEDVERSGQRRVAINEFPMSMEAAAAAQAAGQTVILGAPNLVRGSSHVNGLSVREAVAAGVCDALCSDYSYPALLRAPFLLDELGILPLPEAWQLVSRRPALAAGLSNRGHLQPGAAADCILVDALDGSPCSLRGVCVNGRWALQRDLPMMSAEEIVT
ncbi:MAG: alpha-D-ribose 1-methylphosphonate 5-triphosphate diphosphatase [Planctomycetota bacterium]|nr:MAG: alpha-D-ribose 1-methylphosphonate 5-triphosphate diphosphatase [Planctomycetota bacterium]